MSKVLPSEALWKEGGGYYTEKAEDLRRRPLLPDIGRLRVRRIAELFHRHGNIRRESQVLEVGCGKSMWLPYLAREFGCRIAGVDIEPYAAELARANLLGAGVDGEILCRDAFDTDRNRDLLGRFDLIYSMGVLEHFDDAAKRLSVLSDYLKPGGRILTDVPNLQGVNWLLQRLGSLERLRMHVIYDVERLTRIHARAGLEIVAAGYAGFYDGYISATDAKTARFRRRAHEWLCWASSMAAEAWLRAGAARFAPEIRWLAPHVFCVGRRKRVAARHAGGRKARF